MTRSLVVTDGENEYGGQVGVIKSTSLGYEDHGILTASLVVEWPGGGVSVGGFCLDEPRGREGKDYSRKGTAYGLDHIIWILDTVGVDRWEALVGKTVVVLFEGKSLWGARSVGIAHATDEKKILVFEEHAKLWREGVVA